MTAPDLCEISCSALLTVSFELCASIEQQLEDEIGVIRGTGIDDVCVYAGVLLDEATAAASVAAADTLPLPSECA